MTGSPLDLKGLVSAFVRRWRLFVAVAVAVVVMAVVVSLILRPVYEATTNIRIDPIQKSALDVAEIANGQPPDQSLVDSEVKLMESRDVARAVVQSMNLAADPEFNPGLRAHLFGGGARRGSAEEVATESVLKHLSATREGLTYIVDLKFKSHNAAKAAAIADALARQYVQAGIVARAEQAAAQATGINDRLSALDSEVKQADAAVASYKAANGIVTGATGGTVTEQQIGTLTGELATADSNAAAAKATYDAARAQVEQSGLGSVSTVLNSPVIVELRKQLAEVQRQQAEINARYGPKHPETIKIQQQVDGLNAQIHEESLQIINGLASDARAAAARAASLRADLNGLQGQQATNSRASVVADTMEREAEAKRNTYNQLAASAQQVNQQEHSSTTQALIVSHASVPTKPSFPNKPVFVALGSAIGLLLGAAAVFAAEFMDSGLRTVEDIERDLGASFITSAPLLNGRALKVDGQRIEAWDYVMARPMSGYAEAMRGIRGALTLSDIDRRKKVVVITSALPSEGKTVTSVALARTMAMSGEKVLLIDCDLRRNSLESLVTKAPGFGLIEVLTGAAPLSAALVEDTVKGLDILCVYKATFTPRDLFGSARMTELLNELRGQYDHIVLDAPPLLAVSDARTLATLADAVVMIARWGSTPRNAVRAGLDLLARDGAPLIGVVLSMVDTHARRAMSGADPSYYYEHYRRYYQD
jgi:exopolysaccharide transport family protein